MVEALIICTGSTERGIGRYRNELRVPVPELVESGDNGGRRRKEL